VTLRDHPFVDIDWLRRNLDQVVKVDVRWYLDGRSGRETYERGHLPGATFVDLDTTLAAPPSAAAGRHPLPTPATFAAGLGAAGIGDADTVIAYDDQGGVVAARLVWMLRVIGHEAAVLDGGIQAWDGALETGPSKRAAATFRPRPWPDQRLISIEEIPASEALLLDAREPPRFRGEIEPIDPRAGHIPGAVSLPCRENLDPDGRLRPPDQLRARLEAAGVKPGIPIVSYCGSGVTACHNLLVLEQAGLGAGRLFPGSWSQWSSDPDRPIATGE
jgi:thiosulfate/3-mercaptopyruvate sulfurtransferase